jgi:oligoendopeptidase F
LNEFKQKQFLKHKPLQPFWYQLERIFKSATYRLTEQEEQLADLLSQTSYDMWVHGQQKVQNEQTVQSEGKEIPISEASNKIANLPKKERRDLNMKITEKLKSISHFAEAEINAIYNFKKIMDERCGYKNPYSATVIDYENDEKSIENMISSINKNFKIEVSLN